MPLFEAPTPPTRRRRGDGAGRHAVVLGVTALVGAACYLPFWSGRVSIPTPTVLSGSLETRQIAYRVPEREGQLSRAATDSLRDRIALLQAQPHELHHAVGDTVDVAREARVLAIDSDQRVLGELAHYDFAFEGKGFRLLRDGRVVVRRAGLLRFTARLPSVAASPLPREPTEARLDIIVHRAQP
jgi:hypothetical protein